MKVIMKKIISSILISLLACQFIIAQTNAKFDGQIRQRFERGNKSFSDGAEASSLNFLRTRFGSRFMLEKDVSGYIQVQDSRIYGMEFNTLSPTNNIDLHQAYVSMNSIFDLPVDVKLGRMETSFGPQRLVGTVGWHNVGRSFDGVLFNWHLKKSTISLFNFKLRETDSSNDENDNSLQGAYADLNIVDGQTTHSFVIMERQSFTSNLRRITAGAFAKGKIGPFTHETEFAIQGARVEDLFELAGKMAAVNLTYTMNGPSKTAFSAGVDYLSGANLSGNSNSIAFNTLFATNHKYYGYMDYFLNLPRDTFGKGLKDLHAKMSFMPGSNTKAASVLHIFKSSEDYILADGSSSTSFGSEIDFTLNHKYSSNVSFVGGFSIFLPGDIFSEERGGNSLASWLYFSTVVNLK